MPLIYGEGDNAFSRLQEEIERATKTTSSVPKALSLLQTVEGAVFDAREQTHRACHPETRLDLLQQIQEWALQPDSKAIFWLNGMAGTGKSTISFTFAQWLASQRPGSQTCLGASFFFKRGEGDRSSASLLFPTIAAQISIKSTTFDNGIVDAFTADPRICNKALVQQFDQLIRIPARRLEFDASAPRLVIILDALDECENPDDVRTVLQLLSSVSQDKCTSLRFFVTSRPELAIRIGFKKLANEAHQDVILHDVPQPVIEHDIRVYLTSTLREIREEYNLEPLDHALPDDWPSARLLQSLITLAVPLFIVATTISRFIKDDITPQTGLERLLQTQTLDASHGAGKIYSSVLQASTKSKDPLQRDQIQQAFRHIVGAIITLTEPLSQVSLANLLAIRVADIKMCLRPLHSVILISEDNNVPIRSFHRSFPEYLVSREAQHTPYGIDGYAAHNMLLNGCLQLMSGPSGLRENICELDWPGQFRRDISWQRIQNAIPAELRYACRYWVHHLQSGASLIYNDDVVHAFLQRHLLHWLEVLSFMGRLTEAVLSFKVLYSRVADNEDSVATFLTDASRFLLTNRHSIAQAPLQLYSSATIFAPQTSQVRHACGNPPDWITNIPTSAASWNAKLITLEFEEFIKYYALSVGRGLLATIHDKLVRLVDLHTGEEVQQIETSHALALDFTCQGLEIAVLYPSGLVKLWNTRTGLLERCVDTSLETNFGETRPRSGCIACSTDGSHLVTALLYVPPYTGNYTISVCNTVTGHIVRRIEFGFLKGIQLSPDGSLLAFSSSTGLRIWNILTNRESLVSTDVVEDINFCDESPLLLTRSSTGVLSLRDTGTFSEIRRAEPIPVDTRLTALSPDGTTFATIHGSGSSSILNVWATESYTKIYSVHDKEMDCDAIVYISNECLALISIMAGVRIWNLVSNANSVPSKQPSITTTRLSIHGSLLAVGFDDGSAWIKDMGMVDSPIISRLQLQVPVQRLTFAPDDSLIAVQAGYTVTLWNVQSGTQVEPFGGVGPFAFSPDASCLAIQYQTGRICVWSVSTREEVYRLVRPKRLRQVCTGLKFSEDGCCLVLAFNDDSSRFHMINTIEVWQLSTGREVRATEYNFLPPYTAPSISPDCFLFAHQQRQSLRSREDTIDNLAYDMIQVQAITDGQTVLEIRALSGSRARFLKSGQGIQTDEETFYFDSEGLRSGFRAEKRTKNLYIKDDWIRYGQHNLLWLPTEYRSKHSKVYDNVVAIVHTSGQLKILEFDIFKLVGFCSEDGDVCSQCARDMGSRFTIVYQEDEQSIGNSFPVR